MKIRYSFAAAFLLVAAAAGAQNLNPTVEVTNVYASSAKDISKPVQEMAVPDSVTVFNLKLDYSVFDSPYKGAYEFSPYTVDYTPSSAAGKGRQFYLRAGAGYSLHPEFEAVWSPVLWDRVRLDLFARHDSFFGNYRGLKLKEQPKGSRDIISLVWDGTEDSYGYDARTDVGVKALYPWKKGEAYLTASYTNLSGKDYLITRSLNGVRLGAGVKSVGAEKFRYAASAHWTHWGDYGSHVNPYTLKEDKVDLLGDFAIPMSVGEIFARTDFSLDHLKGVNPGTAALLGVTPGYRFTLDDWYFDLGVRFDIYFGGERFNKFQFVYPAVYVSYTLLDGDMVLYASATGKAGINAYCDVVSGSHIFNPLHSVLPGSILLDNTVERVRASLGFKGHAWRRFHYDVHAGYARVANGLLDGILLKDPETGTDLAFPLPATGYAKPYHMGFIDIDYGWISDEVKVDGTFSFKKTDIKYDQVFAPALVSGTLRGSYTWNKRITAGLTLDFSSNRTAKVSDDIYYRIPGYADLGIFGEYQINRMLSAWLKLGNLLHSANQVIPLYTNSGIYFTAGITLAF